MKKKIKLSDGKRTYIEIQQAAKLCAQEQLGQGWSASPTKYELANFDGDKELLETELGRELTTDECREYERAYTR